MKRSAKVTRKTNETNISGSMSVDGTGEASINTSIPFFDHMLNQIARHGFFDLTVDASGDLEVDFHHTVEDVGIVMGEMFKKAVGDKKGIRRYGAATVPLDEALAEVVIDISGRPYFAYRVRFPGSKVGNFDTELVEEFFRAFSVHSQITLHISVRHGKNLHHITEAIFKAFARALNEASETDARVAGIPSTKGLL